MTEARDAEKVARWELMPGGFVERSGIGRLVNYSDYEALRAEHDRLRAERDVADAAVEDWIRIAADNARDGRAYQQTLESSVQALRQALEELAIDGVTSGASPKKEGEMFPPLWHMRCKLCGANWSGTQWKQPREHPPSPASSLRQPCILAALPAPPKEGE